MTSRADLCNAAHADAPDECPYCGSVSTRKPGRLSE